MAKIIINIKITLVHAMEFLKSVDGALVGIVEEQTTNGRSDQVSVRMFNNDHLHKVWRDRVVEPGDDTLVDMQPVHIMPRGLSIDCAVDVIIEAEFAEDGIEEGTPDLEVVVAVVQGHRHMSEDVDVLDDGGGD